MGTCLNKLSIFASLFVALSVCFASPSSASDNLRVSGYVADYSLEYPANGWIGRVLNSDNNVPEYVIVERAEFIGESGGQIGLDVWRDATKQTITQWIESHRSTLGLPYDAPSNATVSRLHFPAVMYIQRSEEDHVFDQTVVFFRSDEHVFRLTHLNVGQVSSENIFQHMLDSFEFLRNGASSLNYVDIHKEDLPILVYECAGHYDDCICGANNPYPCCSNPQGNCTWWAWDRACCVWNDALSGWGNANQWAGNAAAAGYSVSMTPALNTIACNSNAAGGLGHVAWVVNISGSQVQVTEMGWCLWGVMRTTWYNTSYFDQGFIYPQGSSPNIAVINPSSGQTFCTTQNADINWTPPGGVSNVRVDLYQGTTNPSGFLRVIIGSTSNDGNLLWNPVDSNLPAACNYFIGISDAADGNPWGFSAAFCIANPPLQVPGVSASDNNCNNVTISWTDVANETGYRIMRNGIQIATAGGNITSYADGGATQGVTYTYTVRAYNSCGDGPLSNADTGIRLTVPGQVTGVVASDNLCPSVSISWNNLAYESNYRIRRSGVIIATVAAEITSYTDNTATPGLLHSYTVQAYNACGDGLESNPDNGTRASTPNQVTGVSATDGQCANVVVTWNNASWETGYNVYRNGLGPEIVGADITTYTDNSANPGTVYSYTVAAYNSCGAGAQSTPDNGFRALAPGQVSGVVATDDLCPEIIVTWTNLFGESGYSVFREGALLANVGADVTLYADQTAVPGQSYSYRVAATSSCGTGAQSNPDVGTRRAPPSTVADLAASDDLCGDIVVTWTDVTGEDGYLIFQNMVQITSVPANVTSYTDPNMPPGQYYFYAVKAYNSCGAGGFSNEDVGRVMPTPVQVLGVTASEDDCDGILITWQDQADEQAYYVRRNGSSIGTVPPDVTSFFDEYTTPGVVHSYTVAAGTSCTTGPQSASDTGVRLEAAPAPSACNATDNDCFEIAVTWTDNSSSEFGFNIYRNGLLTGTVGADFELFVDSPVPGNYFYTVKAVSDCGESVASNSDSGVRLGTPNGPPTCQASDTSCAGITITWTDVSDNEAGFEIYRDSQWIGSTIANTTTYFDDAPASVHSYSVAAINTCGSSSLSGSDQGTRLSGVAQPSNCQATDTSCAMIVVSWNDNSNNETRFYIYRDGVQLTHVGANVNTYYLLSGLGCYNFNVRAYNPQCGFSFPSNSDSGRFLTAPLPLAWIEASDTSSLGVYLIWDSGNENVTDYDIYRDAQYIATTPAAMPSFFDEPGDFVVHQYCLIARNQCGDSDSACDNGQVLPGITIPEDLVIKYNGGLLWFYWQPLRDQDENLIPNVIYSLHRGNEPDFLPTEQTYYVSTSDTLYVDTPEADRAFYRIVAEFPAALNRNATARPE